MPLATPLTACEQTREAVRTARATPSQLFLLAGLPHLNRVTLHAPGRTAAGCVDVIRATELRMGLLVGSYAHDPPPRQHRGRLPSTRGMVAAVMPCQAANTCANTCIAALPCCSAVGGRAASGCIRCVEEGGWKCFPLGSNSRSAAPRSVLCRSGDYHRQLPSDASWSWHNSSSEHRAELYASKVE